MNKCIFCKIINNQIDSAKIWENDEFLAILDIAPNTTGMTLVLTKKHYPSYIFDMPEEMYIKLIQTVKKVVKILEAGLDGTRIAVVVEGMGINHAHVKLYPLHGVKAKKFKEMWCKEKVFFEKYNGYITTQLGEKVDLNKLKKLAKKIKQKSRL
jgi:diadenosine tetraphosphate (Ap4A) HIT family hydrolase